MDRLAARCGSLWLLTGIQSHLTTRLNDPESPWLLIHIALGVTVALAALASASAEGPACLPGPTRAAQAKQFHDFARIIG